MLTLVFTPALLSARVWVTTYVLWIARLLVRIGASRRGRVAQDWALRRMARKTSRGNYLGLCRASTAEKKSRQFN